MKTFREMAEEVTVKHGEASEGLNKSIANLLMDIYLKGIDAGASGTERKALKAEVEKIKAPL